MFVSVSMCVCVCLCLCVSLSVCAPQGIAELKESTADESLLISWRQTQRQRSGLSCLAVHPSHWTISIDTLPSEDERIEVCGVFIKQEFISAINMNNTS